MELLRQTGVRLGLATNGLGGLLPGQVATHLQQLVEMGVSRLTLSG